MSAKEPTSICFFCLDEFICTLELFRLALEPLTRALEVCPRVPLYLAPELGAFDCFDRYDGLAYVPIVLENSLSRSVIISRDFFWLAIRKLLSSLFEVAFATALMLDG